MNRIATQRAKSDLYCEYCDSDILTGYTLIVVEDSADNFGRKFDTETVIFPVHDYCWINLQIEVNSLVSSAQTNGS